MPSRDMDEAEYEELRKKLDAEEAERRAQAEEAFRTELVERLTAAYAAGAENAVSAEARRAVAVRGYALFGVVAAVVAMPLLAMALGLDPQAFGSYMAPVTGIAGTVVGYWFGAVGQGGSPTERQK
jgi:lipopolysaccharide export LptBFGC system permease protein LptF